MAWLLAVSRILSGDPALSNRDAFVTELESLGVVADSSRISRWESGNNRIRTHVIRAYETALGAPDQSFVAVGALLRRANGDTSVTAEAETEVVDDDTLDAMLAQVPRVDMSGADWMRLTTQISLFDRFYVQPELRVVLCDRLIIEMQLAVGHARLTRMAAADLLMAHPAWRRPMLRSLGSHVLNPDAQVFRPGVMLLRDVDDGSAGELVLRLMHDPRPNLSMAAAGVAAIKLSAGHYDTETLPVLEQQLLHMLNNEGGSPRVLDALDLVSRLPEESCERVLPAIASERLRVRAVQVRATGELQPPDVAREVSRAITHVAQATTAAPYAQEPDQMLLRLVREALFHARRQRRKLATQVLGCSPYQPALVNACFGLLDASEFIAARSWDMLRHLGHDRPAADLAGAVLAETRTDAKKRALNALGAAPGPLGPADALAISAIATSGAPELRHAAMFALGMTASGELQRLKEHPSEELRRAAAWWREVGPAVTDTTGSQRGALAN